MLSTLTKLAQKPTDKTIRLIRFVFAVLVSLVLYFGYSVTAWNFSIPQEAYFWLMIFPIIWLVRAAIDPGIMRKKLWKWTIVTLWWLMLVTSLVFIDDIEPTTTTVTQAPVIDLSGVKPEVSRESSFTLSTDNWFGFFGFVLVLVGLLLNNKNITTKNERYGEVVKKIRV